MASRSVSAVHKRVVLKPTYRVVNIVASTDLQIDLDLYGLAKMSHDVDYEPEQFPGAIFKVHEPKGALLLFKNGKMICTGTSTEADVKRAIGIGIELIEKFRSSSKHNSGR
jgi:transcription initiation factor TFIID TATA-box-binding protein